MFISTMLFFDSLSSRNPLKCLSMKDQECKVRPEIVSVNSKDPMSFLLVLKQLNAVVVVTILMIPMENCVFLMWLKT